MSFSALQFVSSRGVVALVERATGFKDRKRYNVKERSIIEMEDDILSASNYEYLKQYLINI